MAHLVYLALGTNIGDRLTNLRAALDAFAPDVIVKAESPVYETEPWGYADQPAFLNMVVCVGTELSPLELLTHLKAVEQTLGRVPSFRNDMLSAAAGAPAPAPARTRLCARPLGGSGPHPGSPAAGPQRGATSRNGGQARGASVRWDWVA